MTRTKSVEEDGVTEEEYLGYENEKFRFDHLPNKIEFVEFSTLEQSPLTLLEYFE